MMPRVVDLYVCEMQPYFIQKQHFQTQKFHGALDLPGEVNFRFKLVVEFKQLMDR